MPMGVTLTQVSSGQVPSATQGLAGGGEIGSPALPACATVMSPPAVFMSPPAAFALPPSTEPVLPDAPPAGRTCSLPASPLEFPPPAVGWALSSGPCEVEPHAARVSTSEAVNSTRMGQCILSNGVP